ncbi:hypothetical protein CIK44_20690 [Bacillus sp. X2(2017)]|nr:hypothetical protein CIK44_20690 [Bacillus sp. X2(2017)]
MSSLICSPRKTVWIIADDFAYGALLTPSLEQFKAGRSNSSPEKHSLSNFRDPRSCFLHAGSGLAVDARPLDRLCLHDTLTTFPFSIISIVNNIVQLADPLMIITS